MRDVYWHDPIKHSSMRYLELILTDLRGKLKRVKRKEKKKNKKNPRGARRVARNEVRV